MAEFDIQSAMERIEVKLDGVIKDHEGRIASSETSIKDIKDDMRSAEVKSWIKAGGAYVLAVASHFGLGKLGVK